MLYYFSFLKINNAAYFCLLLEFNYQLQEIGSSLLLLFVNVVVVG